MADRHERAVELESVVGRLTHEGELRKAAIAFDRGWENTILSRLPLRYPFILRDVDDHAVTELRDASSSGKPPEVVMSEGVDRLRKSAIAVGIPGRARVLGFLPDDAVALLDDADQLQSLYAVKLLALRDSGSSPAIEAELVRPDLRQCSACQVLHDGQHENCTDCRSRRRRKHRTLEETAEAPSVPTQQAFHRMTEALNDPNR